jgi:hypothetical protein
LSGLSENKGLTLYITKMTTGHDDDALLGPDDDETLSESDNIFSALKTIQSTMEYVATGINRMGDAFTALATEVH